jgi:hypothetical protein
LNATACRSEWGRVRERVRSARSNRCISTTPTRTRSRYPAIEPCFPADRASPFQVRGNHLITVGRRQFLLWRFVLFSTSCSGSTRASASARTTEKWLDGGQYALRTILGSSPRMTVENAGRHNGNCWWDLARVALTARPAAPLTMRAGRSLPADPVAESTSHHQVQVLSG